MKNYSHFYSFPKAKLLPLLLHWGAGKFDFLAYFEGNSHAYPRDPFDNLFFAGNKGLLENELFENSLHKEKVGIIGYDFKNQIEKLESKNPEFFTLPDLCFFEPEIAFQLTESGFFSKNGLPDSLLKELETFEIPEKGNPICSVSPQIPREIYLEKIKIIQNEIREGNTYEANFCQAFSGEFESWDPISAYLRLNELSKMPFSGLFKAKNKWLVSASPERFLKKSGQQLIAQPIKGTVQRGRNEEEDTANREILLSSEKERAENLMITDLTRNDLARVSKTGSVRVEELFGIYPLPRVFQMISTVSSEVKPDITFREIIQASFPMGSMTGAPKISTMEIIEREESFRRGWFSGAFGWIDEDGNFDFSVVIRSIIADLEAKKLYFGVGSAITIDASAEQEYEECALKAQAILELLSGK
ncbi:anthranilate synthase component I family protein [Algoriphagus sp. A40]|uniref:anthranilate synthase component I family protein n=1 Tax=Algoriphagus sp. A40 TaxID=1945863 RepID=UPI0009840DDF|nr:anthranilate synthase component I family protein [Algoriphagus sp. A40]OOG77182.1 chorismate-binding protein [Algoriphagus sp. A40]